MSSYGLIAQLELFDAWWNGLAEEEQREILLCGGYSDPYRKGDMLSENVPDARRLAMAKIAFERWGKVR
jgi:hypothetical protein